MCGKQIIEILAAALTPIIAIITVWIARQQLESSRLKIKFDKYDRRLNVYRQARLIILVIVQDATASRHEIYSYMSNVADAKFLFGENVGVYVDEIFKRALNICELVEKFRRFEKEGWPDVYDKNSLLDQQHAEFSWFVDQLVQVESVFKPYLDISKE